MKLKRNVLLGLFLGISAVGMSVSASAGATSQPAMPGNMLQQLGADWYQIEPGVVRINQNAGHRVLATGPAGARWMVRHYAAKRNHAKTAPEKAFYQQIIDHIRSSRRSMQSQKSTAFASASLTCAYGPMLTAVVGPKDTGGIIAGASITGDGSCMQNPWTHAKVSADGQTKRSEGYTFADVELDGTQNCSGDSFAQVYANVNGYMQFFYTADAGDQCFPASGGGGSGGGSGGGTTPPPDPYPCTPMLQSAKGDLTANMRQCDRQPY